MVREARQRILVVEDEPLTALRIQTLIRDLGVEVVGPSGNLREALQFADVETLAGAVLDVNLQGIPVYSLADRLALRGVPFVFLTGYADAVPPAHADRPVLRKPFHGPELARVLAETFQIAAAGDTAAAA
jgi:CheY-like chemotaxis protein